MEHLTRRPDAVAELAAAGAIFVTSAVESLSDEVLSRLDKGHTRADAFRAFEVCARAGLALRPTLVPVTPWSTLEDYLELLEVFRERGWLRFLDPVQLSVRLLVPPGSLLLEAGPRRPGAAAPAHPIPGLEELDEAALTWRWSHPDPRMDRLQRKVAAAVEAGVDRRADPAALVAEVESLALAAAGQRRFRIVSIIEPS